MICPRCNAEITDVRMVENRYAIVDLKKKGGHKLKYYVENYNTVFNYDDILIECRECGAEISEVVEMEW